MCRYPRHLYCFVRWHPKLRGPSQGQLVTLGPFCVLDFIVLSAQKGGRWSSTESQIQIQFFFVFSTETLFLRFIFNVDLKKIYLRTYHPLEASFHFLQVKSKFVSYQKFPGVSEESHCLGPKETPGHNSGEDEGDKEDDDEGADEDVDEDGDEDEEKR